MLTAAHCAKGGKRKQLSVFAGGPHHEPVADTRREDPLFGKERGFQQGSMICALGKLVRRFHSRLPFHSTSCSGDSGGPVVAGTPAARVWSAS